MTEEGNALTFENQPLFIYPYVDLDLPSTAVKDNISDPEQIGQAMWTKFADMVFKGGGSSPDNSPPGHIPDKNMMNQQNRSIIDVCKARSILENQQETI